MLKIEWKGPHKKIKTERIIKSFSLWNHLVCLSQCMYINVYEQFNWFFANYHPTLTIANVISWNVAVWNFRLEKNEKKKFPNLPYPSWV